MLRFFRKKSFAKAVFWGLVIIIVPAFVLWGTGSLSRSKKEGPNYVGIVLGKKVSFEEFSKHIAGTRCQVYLSYWNQPEILARVFGDRAFVAQFAWQRLIFLKEAEVNRIAVSDDDVIAFIRAHPIFSRNGAFNRELYEYILRNNFGLSARSFEEFARDYIKIIKLERLITRDVRVDDSEILAEYRKENEKVRLRYVLIEDAAFSQEITVDDAAIAERYRQDPERYTVPPMSRIRFIAFRYDDAGGDIEAVRKARDFSMKASQDPGRFNELAQEVRLEVRETGLFSAENVPEDLKDLREIRDIAFTFTEGQISDAIIPALPDAKACFVVQIVERLPRRPANLIEASDRIREELIKEESKALAGQYAEKIYAGLSQERQKDGFSFESALAQFPMKVRETGLIARNATVEGAGASAPLWDAASGLEVGAFSAPIETERGFAIIEPLEFQKIDESVFAKEKDVFTNKVLAAKRERAVDEWFKGVAAKTTLSINLDEVDRYLAG